MSVEIHAYPCYQEHTLTLYTSVCATVHTTTRATHATIVQCCMYTLSSYQGHKDALLPRTQGRTAAARQGYTHPRPHVLDDCLDCLLLWHFVAIPVLSAAVDYAMLRALQNIPVQWRWREGTHHIRWRSGEMTQLGHRSMQLRCGVNAARKTLSLVYARQMYVGGYSV